MNETFNSLFRQIEYLSYLHYYILSESNDWGELGQEQIEQSFSRLILKTPVHHLPSYSDKAKFIKLIQKKWNDLGISLITLGEAKEIYSRFQFSVDHHVFPIQKIPAMNTYLQSQGYPFFVQGGYYGTDIEVILAEGDMTEFGAYKIYTIDHEYVHTPNTIIPMAAVIGQKEIFVRLRSLETIYHLKWEASANIASMIPCNDHDVSSLIKRAAMTSYSASLESFVQQKHVFLRDLKDLVTHHECGHAIIQHHLLPPDVASLGEASAIFQDNIITALLEILADLAPRFRGMMGPLAAMTELEDSKHCERQFFMYLSDTFFYDTPDEFMYHYTDLIFPILSSCLTKEGHVDSQLLGRYVDDSESSLVRWALSLTARSISCFHQTIETVCTQHSLSLDDLLEKAKHHVDEHIRLDPDSYEYDVAVWAECLTSFLDHPEVMKDISAFLSDLKKTLLEDLQVQLLESAVISDIPTYRNHYQTVLREKILNRNR